MKPLKSISNPLIAGTLLLTVTGLSSRVIGFFYRIFLFLPSVLLSVPQASRPLSPALLLQPTIKIPA